MRACRKTEEKKGPFGRKGPMKEHERRPGETEESSLSLELQKVSQEIESN